MQNVFWPGPVVLWTCVLVLVKECSRTKDQCVFGNAMMSIELEVSIEKKDSVSGKTTIILLTFL